MAHYRLNRLLLLVVILAVLSAPLFTVAESNFLTDNDPTNVKDNSMSDTPLLFPLPEDKLDSFTKILTADTSAHSIPDAPLQLVRPDHEHKKLVIVEENLKFLHSITQPVATISVVGKFHSGKSFLMNQLMAKSNGFGIGSRVTPQTMGIWVWGKPLKINNPAGPSQWILLLDTEGFAASNVSENYDAKIFAVSTLLSSKLLYNSVKIIDQSDIDYLELLARRTQLFALKAQMTPQADWTGDFSLQLLDFPSLIWVIQDFVQETNDENCRQWLLRLLSAHTRETESYEISLKDIFPSVDCHTLFIPSARKIFLTDLSKANEADLTEEYRLERDELIAKIKSSVKPKTKNDKPFTGSDLVLLLRILVNAANAGSLTNIPNRWDAFLDQLQKSAVEDCYKFYHSFLSNLLVDQAKNEPVNVKRLQSWHEKSQHSAFDLLSHLLQGLSKSLEASKPELDDLITRYYSSVSELNRQKIHVKLFNVQKSFELKVVDEFLLLQLPILTSQLKTRAEELDTTFAAQFTATVGDLVEPSNLTSYLESLSKSVKLNLDSTTLLNNQKLEQFFDNVTSALVEEAFSEVKINFVSPLSHKAFESMLKQSFERTLSAYGRKVEQFTEETAILSAKYDKLKVALLEKADVLRADNERSVGVFLRKESQQFLNDFDRITSTFKKNFPMDFEELKKVLGVEVDKFKGTFVGDLANYKQYQIYQTVYEAHSEQLANICERREKENFQAYQIEVEMPLKMAKKSVLLSGGKYATLFSFKRFVTSSCLLHLDDGKAKHWPQRLKLQIIDAFMEEDEELKREVDSRTGLWSRFVGFFQWLASLIFG